MRCHLATLLVLLASFTLVRAEFRVALLIDNDGNDLGPVVKGLEKFGFRCEIAEKLSGQNLSKKIGEWAGRTPTNSTALLYVATPVEKAPSPGNHALGSVPIGDIFGLLSTRGGSRTNVVVAHGKDTPEFGGKLPEGSFFAFADLGELATRAAGTADLLASIRLAGKSVQSTLPPTATISGRGSVAISPPDKFVPGTKVGDEWVNTRGMVFCWCPPGKFIAGSPKGTPGRFDDEEQREVVIQEGFWMGKYELTSNHSLVTPPRKAIAGHKAFPVNMVHWDDGIRMTKLTLTEDERKAGRLPEGWQYHLPSAEQWEYAARAGTTTRFYFGDDISLLPRHANFADKSFYDTKDIYSNYGHRTLNDGVASLAPAGSYLPNPWGLHDVYGNVAEWCRDHFALGGSWSSVGDNCRSAYRITYGSRDEQRFLGYRIVIQPNVPEPVPPPKPEKKPKK